MPWGFHVRIWFQGFITCKALPRRNGDPGAASRPWDRDRDGFVMGEGAGARPWGF